MIAIVYLLKMLLCSAILYSYYFFFLRNKNFHQYNRYYLLLIILISTILPLINIEVFHQHQGNLIYRTLDVIAVNKMSESVEGVDTQARSALFPWESLFTGCYLLICTLLGYLFCRSVLYIRKLSRSYPAKNFGTVRFYNTDEPGTPFSFFNHLFWNSKINPESATGQTILRHELFHINEKHSTDRMLVELSCVLFWINPFFHLIKKEVIAIHEFLADEHAAKDYGKEAYAEMLVVQSITTIKEGIINPFFHHQIKRRVNMIVQSQKNRFVYLRRLMPLPLLFVLFCAFAFKTVLKDVQENEGVKNTLTETINVVIDAGHGGVDPGAQSKDGSFLEKDINLAIAKKIELMSKGSRVNIIMTRQDDLLPGNATTISEGLKNRVRVMSENKADLFISIHAANAETFQHSDASGFEIFVSNKNASPETIRFGSIVNAAISKLYKVEQELKQSISSGIYVLDKAVCPAILIECGYLSNNADLKFISDEKNQEQLAKNIIEAINSYQQTKTQ